VEALFGLWERFFPTSHPDTYADDITECPADDVLAKADRVLAVRVDRLHAEGGRGDEG
jgi:hypothetical protein